MDVTETIKALGAELAANRAVALVAGEHVIVARVVGGKMVLTAEGEALAASVKPAEPTKPASTATKKEPSKRVRARNEDGTLKGDDPSTPDVNEAWTDGDR
jgi:hypothetical protein